MDAICRLGLATTIAQSHGALLVRMGECYYSSVNHIRNEYYMNMGETIIANYLLYYNVEQTIQIGQISRSAITYP